VRLLVRGESLAGMSAYLITQLTATPHVEVKLHTQITDAHGDTRLEAFTREDTLSGERERLPATAVFIMIGAEPCTEWLRHLICLDRRGFILTDRDIPRRAWPLERADAVRNQPAGRVRGGRCTPRLHQTRRGRGGGGVGRGGLGSSIPDPAAGLSSAAGRHTEPSAIWTQGWE
jgi:hypothetical protein